MLLNQNSSSSILILCQVLLHADKVEDRKTWWRSSSADGLVYIEAAEDLCGRNILIVFIFCTLLTLNLVNTYRNLTVVCLVLGRPFLIDLILSYSCISNKMCNIRMGSVYYGTLSHFMGMRWLMSAVCRYLYNLYNSYIIPINLLKWTMPYTALW